MKRIYEVIPCVQWRRDDGMTASVYGACPWQSAAEKDQWQRMQYGWTVRNTRDNTVGIGRLPWASRKDAERWVVYREHIRGCGCTCHDQDQVHAEGNAALVVRFVAGGVECCWSQEEIAEMSR